MSTSESVSDSFAYLSQNCAAKTIMLRSCDIENCEETLVEKGEIKKRGQTYCVAGALNDVSYKNDTHTTNISIQYFPKDVAV